MGGDPEVKKFLSDVIAVEAFKRPNTEEWEQLFKSNEYAVIRDYLIFFKGLPVDSIYTLRRLFNHFWRDARDHLFDPFKKISTYVTVCDDRSNVTKAKAVTQSARVEASTKGLLKRGLDDDVTAYPLGTVFVPEGVRLPDSTVEGICLRRLALSRCYDGTRSNLGNHLWAAFHPYIQQEMRELQGELRSRSFIFDYDKTGPWVFDANNSYQRTELAHDLGEADPAGIWWVNFFQNHGTPLDTHLLSSDGDHMPLCALYHAQKPAHASSTKIWWHCDPGNVAADMNKIAEQVLCRFATQEHFALAFYLSGCDYMFKSYYAYYFNCRTIMDAVARVDLDACKQSASKKGQTERFSWVPEFFDAFLLELYYPKLNTVKVAASAAAAKPKSTADYTVESMRLVCSRKKSKTIRFPSEREVLHQAQMLTWLVEYGTTAKDGKKPADPKAPSSELVAERERLQSLLPVAKSKSDGNWQAKKTPANSVDGNWQASSSAVAAAVKAAGAAAASIADTDRALRHKKSKYFMPTAPPSSPNDGFLLPVQASVAISRSVESFLLPAAAAASASPPNDISFGDFDSEIESFA